MSTGRPQNSFARDVYLVGSLLMVLVMRPYELCTGRLMFVGTGVPANRPVRRWSVDRGVVAPNQSSSQMCDLLHSFPYTSASFV